MTVKMVQSLAQRKLQAILKSLDFSCLGDWDWKAKNLACWRSILCNACKTRSQKAFKFPKFQRVVFGEIKYRYNGDYDDGCGVDDDDEIWRR